MTINALNATRRISPRPLSEFDFDVVNDALANVIVEGSVSSHTVQDQMLNLHTSATIDRAARLSASVTDGVPDYSTVTLTNLTTGIATLASDGTLTRVADGTASVLVTWRQLTKRADVAVMRDESSTEDVFVSFATGTLARNCTDAVSTRIDGKDSTASLLLYSAVDDVTGSYTRNTGAWTADIDLSCASVWNSYAGNRFAATLISPRHVAIASHISMPEGTILRFVGSGGTATRTISAVLPLSGCDLTIGLLDSAVPAGVNFATVPPSNLASFLPNAARGIPGIGFDQDRRATVVQLASLADTYGNVRFPVGYSNQTPFARTKRTGDSSFPSFLVINGNAVLLTCWTYPESGSLLFLHIAAINTAMTTLGGGYQLTTADLSGFASY